MATVKEFRMSQERYDELKKELDYSKTTRADVRQARIASPEPVPAP